MVSKPYETIICENGETVPVGDYLGEYGCAGYAIRGPENERLARELTILAGLDDWTGIDQKIIDPARNRPSYMGEYGRRLAVYKRVLERRHRLDRCDSRALTVLSDMADDMADMNREYRFSELLDGLYGQIAHFVQHLNPEDITRQLDD